MATIQQLQAYGYEYRKTQAGHLLVLQPEYVAYVSEILEAAGMRGIVSCNANNLSKQMCVDVEWKDATSQCDRYQQFFVSETSRPIPEEAIAILGGLAIAKDCMVHNRDLPYRIDLRLIQQAPATTWLQAA